MTDGLFLIDTSVWIEAPRPGGIVAIRERLNEILAERKGATTPLIVLELLSGARDEKDYEELSEELSALSQFPVNETLWLKSCRLAFELRRKGVTASSTDVLIAAVAQENQLTLLHADRHFDLIAEKTNLLVESRVKDAAVQKTESAKLNPTTLVQNSS